MSTTDAARFEAKRTKTAHELTRANAKAIKAARAARKRPESLNPLSADLPGPADGEDQPLGQQEGAARAFKAVVVIAGRVHFTTVQVLPDASVLLPGIRPPGLVHLGRCGGADPSTSVLGPFTSSGAVFGRLGQAISAGYVTSVWTNWLPPWKPNAVHINTGLAGAGSGKLFATIYSRRAGELLVTLLAQARRCHETLVQISATHLLSGATHTVEISPHARLCELKQKLSLAAQIPPEKIVITAGDIQLLDGFAFISDLGIGRAEAGTARHARGRDTASDPIPGAACVDRPGHGTGRRRRLGARERLYARRLGRGDVHQQRWHCPAPDGAWRGFDTDGRPHVSPSDCDTLRAAAGRCWCGRWTRHECGSPAAAAAARRSEPAVGPLDRTAPPDWPANLAGPAVHPDTGPASIQP
eukprot:SAG22_NODE_56_length_23716_cov_11.146759_21_plen_414_part_00